MTALKFQRGETVHVVNGAFVHALVVDKIVTNVRGESVYFLNDNHGLYSGDELFATFDNALTELQKQAKSDKP